MTVPLTVAPALAVAGGCSVGGTGGGGVTAPLRQRHHRPALAAAAAMTGLQHRQPLRKPIPTGSSSPAVASANNDDDDDGNDPFRPLCQPLAGTTRNRNAPADDAVSARWRRPRPRLFGEIGMRRVRCARAPAGAPARAPASQRRHGLGNQRRRYAHIRITKPPLPPPTAS